MSQTIRVGFGQESVALDFMRDESNFETLLDLGNGVLRLPDGPGWRLWTSDDGCACVTCYSRSECDAIERGEQRALDDEREQEQLLRDLARHTRDVAPPSIRAPR